LDLTVIFTITLLILLNALYVAGEFAAVSVRKSMVQQLADEGNSLASSILPILEDPVKLDRYIAASQIGITVSSLALGAYGQATLGQQISLYFQIWFNFSKNEANTMGIAFILVILTSLQVLLGELVPKYITLQFPTQAAIITSLPMRFSLWLFSRLIDILNGSGRFFLSILGVKCCLHRHIHSPEEIDMLIAESRDGGVLEPDEEEKLHKALQMVTRPVRKLMVPRLYISAIDVNMPIDKLLKKVAANPYTRIPVYEGNIDNIIGMLHTKDLVKKYAEYGKSFSLEEIIHPVLSVPRNMKADKLLALFREKHAHQAMVLDEFGGFEGLITLEDILMGMLGKFSDELKNIQIQPECLPDGRVRLPGLMPVYEAENWIGILWTTDSATIAGYVLEKLGHVPEPGEKLEIDGVKIEVETVVNNAISSIIANPIEKTEECEINENDN
jgi:CBS domain containing-hemolysin-like protein